MLIEIPLTDLGFGDINVVISGMHECEAGHSYGPAVREYYLIHCITKGEGIFKRKHQEYSLGENQGFLICPRDVTYYRASKHNPWLYYWIGFTGTRAVELLEQAGISIDKPIIDSKECSELFKSIGKTFDMEEGKELYILSVLYQFFSILSKNPSSAPKSYALKAAGYITANMGMELKVESIANMLGIDRRYFCEVFKQEYGISPQKFLINVRMKSAKSLLTGTCLNIADISRSVGYPDALGFSKIFKKYYGVSPTKFRKDV